MADADAHDKENLADAPLADKGGSFMKPTASSKSRFGAPAAAAHTGLRPNLNAGNGPTRPSTAGGVGPQPAAGQRAAGVADLHSFRARLNSVKRESVMRATAAGGASGIAEPSMAPIAETKNEPTRANGHGGHAPSGAAYEAFGGEDPFAPARGVADSADSVAEANRRNFEDPEFVEALEKCLHWRPKALKGFDMREVKEEARVAINQLKQCLQQSLVRKENMVEDLMRAETDKALAAEGIKLREESATAAARAAEKELNATKEALMSAKAAAEAQACELRASNEELAAEIRKMRASAEFDVRRAGDDLEAKDVELGNLRRRHEEAQETLRSVRSDLKETREALSRQERETAALRRDRENGESSYGAERKALEAQIRAKMDEIADERLKATTARSGFETKLREHVGEIEKLTVQNKILNATVAQTNAEASGARSSLSARLAEAESALESKERALAREKLRFEEQEQDLQRALTDTRLKCDGLEEQIVGLTADAETTRRRLAEATDALADSARSLDSSAEATAREMAAKDREISTLRVSIQEKESAITTLRASLKASEETAAGLARELENAAAERREERARLDGEIDRFRTEASENKGRADALLTQQASLIADVKEERRRVAKMEEERKEAVAGGAASAEQARQQAREDLRAAEERHAKAREEMLAEKAAAVEAAREKAALEVAQARADAEKAVEEAEAKAAKAAQTAKTTAEAAVEEADAAADEAEARVEALAAALEAAKADAARAVAELEAKVREAEAVTQAKTAELEEKLELAATDASSAVQAERAAAEEAAKAAASAMEALEAEHAAALASAAEASSAALAAEKQAASEAASEADSALEALRASLASAERGAAEKAEALERALAEQNAATAEALSRLAETEAANAAKAAEMSEAEQKHAELIEQAASAESRVQNVVAQLECERAEVDRLEKEARETAAFAAEAADAAAAAAKAAASEKADMVAELRALRAAAGIGDDGEELSEEQRLLAAAEFETAAQQNDMSAKDATALTSRLVKATKAAEAARRVATDMETFKKIADERLRRIEELESQALDADAVRRALHNQIQELRGNVRVFCRVRPTTSDTAVVDCPADGSSVSILKSGDAGETAAFEFDRVFAPCSTQSEVFEEVSQLVQSALDGYKVCLFSYGQTGSGKTHTMLGEQGAHSENRGVIPRAVAKIVEASEANAKKGWTYELHASYVEIYNEQVRDLLNAGSGHSDRHAIAHVDGVTEVSGVRREPVTSVEAAAALVRRAANARAVEATQMNAVSSRSHTIFMLYVTGEHVASGSKLRGCLNLVDLAGSERVGRSGAEGARLKEACAINKSLSCLGDVFQALSHKQAHVPYRNSKLTYLLQPCLGGDGKTLMFVNINPEAPSAEESMCSLKFAAQVNAVELGGGRGGGAKRNIVSGLTLEKAGSKEGEKAERSAKEDSQRARPQSAAPPGERLKDKRERERRAEEAAKKSKIPRARPETARAALGGPAKKPKKAP